MKHRSSQRLDHPIHSFRPLYFFVRSFHSSSRHSSRLYQGITVSSCGMILNHRPRGGESKTILYHTHIQTICEPTTKCKNIQRRLVKCLCTRFARGGGPVITLEGRGDCPGLFPLHTLGAPLVAAGGTAAAGGGAVALNVLIRTCRSSCYISGGLFHQPVLLVGPLIPIHLPMMITPSPLSCFFFSSAMSFPLLRWCILFVMKNFPSNVIHVKHDACYMMHDA